MTAHADCNTAVRGERPRAARGCGAGGVHCEGLRERAAGSAVPQPSSLQSLPQKDRTAAANQHDSLRHSQRLQAATQSRLVAEVKWQPSALKSASHRSLHAPLIRPSVARPAKSSMPPAAPSLPFTRIGPATINRAATAAIVYNRTLNAGYPPPVNTATAPSLTIGLTWASAGANAVNPALPAMLAFMVDLINGRGGVWMGGVQYSVNILLGDDQSSVSYMQLLYEDMLSQGVQVFITPYGDGYVVPLLPLIHTANATFVNVEPTNPSVFANNTGGNLWSFAPTGDLYLRTSLDLINTATQRLYNQTQSGLTSSDVEDGYISRYGLTTVCAYTANTTLFQLQHTGLLSWIDAENTARRTAGAAGADLVQLLVDAAVPDFGIDGSVYKPYYDACPENVDALVLLVDGWGAIEGMAASELRAKGVVGLTGDDGFNSQKASDVMAAAGILRPIPVDTPFRTNVPGARIASFLDIINLFEMYTAIAYGAPGPLATGVLGYAANIHLIISALNVSRSLDSADMRSGMLGLNGYVGVTGLIAFNASTGVNIARIGKVSQMLPSGTALVMTGPSDVVFPYPWPWDRVSAGDPIYQRQASSWVLLGLVIGVLGVWVAQIITEQAIFARRRGGWYAVWLFVVTLSLGGVGVWCSMLVQSTALSVTLPGADSAQDVSWSLGALLLAVLPCLVLTYCGLLTAISDVEASSSATKRTNVAAGLSAALRAEKSAKKKAAALSNRQHLTYLIDCITWRASLGGLLTAAAVVTTRVTLWSIWVQDAEYASVAWGWVLTLLLDITLIPTALIMFIHALRWRILAVFIFSAAVMADWQIMVSSMRFTYAPDRTAALDDVTISAEGIVLVAGLIAATIAFIFIGLLFRAMKVSRNDLSLIVVELETAVDRQQSRIAQDAHRMLQYAKDVEVLARSLEAVNVLSSLPQDYGLALAMYTSVRQLAAVGEPIKGGSTVTSLLSHPAGTSQITSLSTKHSASELGPEQQQQPQQPQQQASAPARLPPLSQAGHHVLRSGKSSSTVAPMPVTVVSPRGHSSKPSIPQLEHLASQSHISQPAATSQLALSPTDRELEAQMEEALAAILHFRSESSSGSAGFVPDGIAGSTGSISVGRPRVMTNNSGTLFAAQSNAGQPAAYLDFQLAAPLLGKLSSDDGAAASLPAAPSMEAVIDHPVAVEVFKEELRKTQSVESLVFCLHVRRYRAVQSKKARRLLAASIADAFIRTSSSQQVNLNGRQRDSILAIVDKKDATCPATLFDEAERECMLLMRTNVFKGFTASSGYRLCAWLCHSLDVKQTTRSLPGEAAGARGDVVSAEVPAIITRSSQSGAHL